MNSFNGFSLSDLLGDSSILVGLIDFVFNGDSSITTSDSFSTDLFEDDIAHVFLS